MLHESLPRKKQFATNLQKQILNRKHLKSEFNFEQ